MKKVVYAVGALAIVALGYVAYRQLPQSTVGTASLTQYESKVYGFSLSYPSSLAAREISLEDIVFGRIDGEMIDAVAQVRVMDIDGVPGETLSQSAVRALLPLCADVPCTGLSSELPFVTQSGAEGRELYLASESGVRGPFFVVPLATHATGSRLIVVSAPVETAISGVPLFVRDMARSLRATGERREAQSIEVFIRSNISALSPVPETLGGTFYVTRIETTPGTGVVHYEDGHQAYVADLTYDVGADGAPSITSFTVRP
jgi:hypothetical protein